MSAAGPEREPAVARERALALLELSRFDEALAHLARAAAQDPADPLTLCLIAQAKLGLELHAEALEAAGRAVALDPEAEWPHRLRAVALGRLGRKREAAEAAKEACRLDPELPEPHIVLSHALQAAGDEAGALHAARHALELDPESREAHDQLGLVLLDHDREAEAADAFRAALALDPELDTAINNLSVAELRSGARMEALGGFERAAALDPRSHVARANVLAVGGRPRLWRRVTICCALGAVAVLAFWREAELAGTLLFLAALAEVVRWRSLQELSPPTRALVLDDVRARRLKPLRWDWSWPTRLRPWWWVVLERTSPPKALAINAAVFAVLVPAHSLATVVFGVALPFNGWRTWRW